MADHVPQIAQAVVRAGPGSTWESTGSWRHGPATPDGFWVVTTSGSAELWAVRVVVDPGAPVLTGMAAWDAARAATQAPQRAIEDAYLESLTVVSGLDPDELMRLRDAVLTGESGGPEDGAA